MSLLDRSWRDSRPEDVEHDLAALWRDLAGTGPAIARAVMANLVVFRFPDAASDGQEAVGALDEIVEAVVGLHPSRTIIIEHQRGGDTPEGPSSARVGIAVFGSESSRFGIERIVVRSASADVSLPSIVRRFVHGDRPTSLWWGDDLSRNPPSEPVVDCARQLIYDSRVWRQPGAGFRSVGALARAGRIDLADLNWRRLAPLRRALAHAAATLGSAQRPRASIVFQRGEDALAMLLAGWLASRLQLDTEEWPSLEESGAGEFTLRLSFDAGIAVATMDGYRVEVSTPGLTPIVVPVPREEPAESMAAELRNLSRDVALTEAVLAVTAHLV